MMKEIGFIDKTDSLDLRSHDMKGLTDFMNLYHRALESDPRPVSQVKITHYQDAMLQYDVRGLYEPFSKWTVYGMKVIAGND